MTVSEAKQTQRKAGRAARKALGPEERKAANAALCAFLWQLAAVQNAQTILLYAAFGSEADLSALAEKAQAQGKTLAYPVCGEAYSLTAAVPGPDGWEMGQYGIRTPILRRSEILLPEALDLVLVPCTAFDADCFRVGMGKGYYDRYLPRCKNAVKIGIAFEAQRGGSSQTTISVDNDDVVAELRTLRGEMASMLERMEKLRVVLNTGALVGELAEPMDVALGQRSTQRGRGI